MNYITDKICVGAPMSAKRFEMAHLICADCLSVCNETMGVPIGKTVYRALSIGNTFASYDGICYVCERKAHVAVVELNR